MFEVDSRPPTSCGAFSNLVMALASFVPPCAITRDSGAAVPLESQGGTVQRSLYMKLLQGSLVVGVYER